MSQKTTVYNPKEIEEKYYSIWEDRGYFEINGNQNLQKKDKKFCIMMPPPNVTGSLHIGHALTYTLPDIMVRYKRMDGYKTLWQPGMDHAGIATQNVVEKQLLAKGIKKEDIGRKKFIEKVWEWKEYSGGQIFNQMRRLGISPAWSRSRFTMDDGLKASVKKAFVKLYDEGLIIRGNYMINWCTHDGALSDIEVEHQNNKGHLYYLKYFLKNTNDYIVVATTRPETYFGDTAVMVHPDDIRYKDLIGKTVILPLTNKEIKIISDSYVDMEFGTGCVKVTPAHDINDYEIGKKHNLEFITVFDEKGILNENAGYFQGLERLKARNEIVEKLQKEGFVEKIEDYENQVGYCYRCKNIVEPYISKQWFVKKEIANGAIEKVNNHLATFYPSHWINSFNAWMKDLRDWCISRQLWWGHQIPVFYCNSCDNVWASVEDIQEICPNCKNKDIYQDPDVLDTWFSSGLWPFSTLGWGNDEFYKNEKWFEEDLKEFYPNTLMITGFDILFFWVARMMFQGEEALKHLPFKDIYLHALVKDENGQKMSKSKGNVIDPLDAINSHSADSLRFTLASLAAQGRDIKLSNDKLEQMRNFTNKLYNASKFLLLNESKFEDLQDLEIKTQLGKYMKSRFSHAVKETRDFIDQYRFNDASTVLYRFLWNEFCDWGIELSKAQKESIKELGSIFKESMKLLHPFMPFITEYIFQNLNNESLESSTSIMILPYPNNTTRDLELEKAFGLTIESIIAIRRAKATIDMPSSHFSKVGIKLPKDTQIENLFIKKLAKCDEVILVHEKMENSVCDISENLEVFLPLEGVDLSPIITRLKNQEIKLSKESLKLENMLKNEKFVSNAPKEVIEQNQKALNDLNIRLNKIQNELKNLQ